MQSTEALLTGARCVLFVNSSGTPFKTLREAHASMPARILLRLRDQVQLHARCVRDRAHIPKLAARGRVPEPGVLHHLGGAMYVRKASLTASTVNGSVVPVPSRDNSVQETGYETAKRSRRRTRVSLQKHWHPPSTLSTTP